MTQDCSWGSRLVSGVGIAPRQACSRASCWLCWYALLWTLLLCNKTKCWIHVQWLFSSSLSFLSSVNLVSMPSIIPAKPLIKILKNRSPLDIFFHFGRRPLKTNLWKCFFQPVVYHFIMVSQLTGLNKVETLLNSICIPSAATSHPVPIILQGRK